MAVMVVMGMVMAIAIVMEIMATIQRTIVNRKHSEAIHTIRFRRKFTISNRMRVHGKPTRRLRLMPSMPIRRPHQRMPHNSSQVLS